MKNLPLHSTYQNFTTAMENVLEKVKKMKRAKPASLKMKKLVEVDHEEQKFVTSDYLRNVHGHKIAMALFSK